MTQKKVSSNLASLKAKLFGDGGDFKESEDSIIPIRQYRVAISLI